MITIFHCFFMTIRNCINQFIKSLQQNDLEITPKTYIGDSEQSIEFDPPVYKQRYGEIQLTLLNNKWNGDIKKVVDFGCAELKLFMFIKHLFGIREVLEVDVDEYVLREHAFRVEPLTIDYISRRTDPLIVHILKGSIADPDERLLNTDAVIGIEIIEHLHPDVLEALPYNVFGFIKPKIAIFTTPNADFNVLFPNFHGFRHYDHKFEWSREQFETWCFNVIKRFPNYTVSFTGIGKGPEGTEHLGCCSQMSVFVKEFESEVETGDFESSYGICTYSTLSNADNVNTKYELIKSVEYPYEIDERTPKEKVYDELKYRINLMSNINGRFYNEDLLRFEIPLDELIYNQSTHFTTSAEARAILDEAGYKIEECIVCDAVELCVVCEPDMESRSSTPASNVSDINISKDYYSEWTKTEPEPNWEVDKDDDPWIIDISNVEHEEALIYANEIIHNIINNVDLTNIESDKHKRLSKTIKKNDLKSCNSVTPMQSVSNTIKSDNERKDGGCSTKPIKRDNPGISDAKKKKRMKKDSLQNGTANGVHINDESNEDNLIQQICIEVVPEVIDFAVENGDLANNNRDLEGNNYPNALENLDLHGNDNQIVVLDLQDDANQEDVRNNDAENRNEIEPEVAAPNPGLPVPDDRDLEIAFASREALFDPNSQIDLLEEFDVSADGEPNGSLGDMPILQNIVFIGVDADDENADGQIAAVIPLNAEPFPNWLLNLLGAGVSEDNETHDEPHFYCQGDGLGSEEENCWWNLRLIYL
ncbi:hypothetical protein FQR65_LT07017 [Abscondita terminalis]|nr:hypothetical protein FQR65_LT07017 [Abscondita terminalis]